MFQVQNVILNIIYKIAADKKDPGLVSKIRKEIQKKWGVTRQTVSRIISNKNKLSPEKAFMLLDVLKEYGDFTLEDLFEHEEGH